MRPLRGGIILMPLHKSDGWKPPPQHCERRMRLLRGGIILMPLHKGDGWKPPPRALTGVWKTPNVWFRSLENSFTSGIPTPVSRGFFAPARCVCVGLPCLYGRDVAEYKTRKGNQASRTCDGFLTSRPPSADGGQCHFEAFAMSSHCLSSVAVGGVEIQPLRYRGQPVLTFTMMDAVHQRPKGTARKRFNDNIERLCKGTDYFHITRNLPMSEIRTLEYSSPNPMDEIRPLDYIPPKGIILLTESGYLLLVKSFTDALAWEVQRHLVQVYFRAQYAAPHDPDETVDDPLGLPMRAQVFHSGVKMAVDGRALHRALGNQRHFCDWIKQRLSRYSFVENEDFLRFTQASHHPAGGRPSQEYALSVAMAMGLCVLENNPAGWALFRRLQASSPVAGDAVKAPGVSAQLAQLGTQVEVLAQRLEALSQRVEGLSAAGSVDDVQPRLAAWLCGRQQCTLAEIALALFGLPVENLSRLGQQRIRRMLQALGWKAQRGQAVYQPAVGG